MRGLRPVLALALALLAACAAHTRSTTADDADAQPSAPAPAAAPGSSNPVEALGLKVVLNDQTTSGRLMKMRGTIVNPHPEAVTGVRVQIVFLAPTGSEEKWKVLEIQQKEFGSIIAPGESTLLSWDVESMYLGSDGGRFLVAAYPARLGDRDMPPPDHWKE
jgi:hypothetical protein